MPLPINFKSTTNTISSGRKFTVAVDCGMHYIVLDCSISKIKKFKFAVHPSYSLSKNQLFHDPFYIVVVGKEILTPYVFFYYFSSENLLLHDLFYCFSRRNSFFICLGCCRHDDENLLF